MEPADRAKLTAALRDHVGKVAEDLRGQMSVEGTVRERAKKLHLDEQVGEDFDVWTDLLARRGAVLWVLKSVYVRVLEDRGLLSPGRILDVEAQQLFEQLVPNLGENTAFLRWVYRDLASPHGGVPELFTRQPAEIAWPGDELSGQLLAFWRHRDPDSGVGWSFAEEKFEGELMGDLYQELDPVVKQQFALCQTPDFVRGFMLDRTLNPAMEEFAAEEVRLLDPSCGSGHFLIDGFKRLVEATTKRRPGWTKKAVVKQCLERVVGIDLNDYACALARARLVMTAAELAGTESLSDAAMFRPHIYCADGLEQLEKGTDARGEQLDLLATSNDPPPRAALSPPQSRSALAAVLIPRFHVVLANPPYILEQDTARRAYQTQRVGKSRRYVSAYNRYSLASPFTERAFQLAVPGGFVGLITSNNFTKRQFGKPLVEEVLSRVDLTLIVDSSQAFIPFHGTPTILLFGRNRTPESSTVRVVMGKRAEPSVPPVPASGRVWSSIAAQAESEEFDNEFISVADLDRSMFAEHPWSLSGGGAVELRGAVEAACGSRTLESVVSRIGMMTILKLDHVYFRYPRSLSSENVLPRVPIVTGNMVRDYGVGRGTPALFPYTTGDASKPIELGETTASFRHFWRYRTQLKARTSTGFRTVEDRGMLFYEYPFHYPQTFSGLTLTFAFVSTHNHFSLARGGTVFNRSAPAIKLPPDATEDDHLALLGLLNSSTGCFWMKQVFHCKGSQGINEGMKSSLWEQFFEFDATKLKRFPVPISLSGIAEYARELDSLAGRRNAASVRNTLQRGGWESSSELQVVLSARREADLRDLYRMTALQEELDWLCYSLYGLVHDCPTVRGPEVESYPPTCLPWLMNLSQSDQAIRDRTVGADEPQEIPSTWFARHGWLPHCALPADCPAELARRIDRRQKCIEENGALKLLETATYKRRWFRPDYPSEEKSAFKEWLQDHVESALCAQTRPLRLGQIVAAVQNDRQVLAIVELLAGRPDYDLGTILAAVVSEDAVPQHPYHLYKPRGLDKRAAWENMWVEQRRHQGKPPSGTPPTYTQTDFLNAQHYRIRGKFDVPRERFIAFTEVPTASGPELVYGSRTWSPLQILGAALAIDEDLEDQGVDIADRIGLLHTAWGLVPEAAVIDAAAAGRLKAELQALLGPDGPSPAMLEDWARRFPAPGVRDAATRGSAKKRKREGRGPVRLESRTPAPTDRQEES